MVEKLGLIRLPRSSAGGLRFEQLLDLIEDIPVDNCRVLTRKPFILVGGFTDVKSVLQEIGYARVPV